VAGRRIALAGCLLLLTVIAVAPLLRATSPCTHDGALHYYRIVATRRALEGGILFSRWLPDLAFGYGFPFFNYRAPGSYYAALALHLGGLGLPLALNLIYALAIAGSAFAAFLLARDLFGTRAGFVAAAAYAYAPYQFLNALARGNLPESAALPLFPLILWAFRRLALDGRRRWFVLGTCSLAALYLTHNISSLLFTPLLVAYLLVLWLAHRRNGRWTVVACALLLALGVTAFFWAPALLEKQYVHLEQSRNNRNNDFHFNFVSPAEMLAPPSPVDTSLMNPPIRVHLGLAQTALAGIGLAVGLARARGRERRALLLFFAAAAGTMAWLSTSSSTWVWEHVPLLPFVQFPWRLIGRAALPLTLLASASFADEQQRDLPIRRVVRRSLSRSSSSDCSLFHRSLSHSSLSHYPSLLAIALLVLSAFFATFPPQGSCPSAPYPTTGDLYAYEHAKLVGVDPTGSYFPIWVTRRPDSSPIEAHIAAGEPAPRFDESALPEGASIVEQDYGPNRARVTVETPEPFHARYLTFYFPGWRARVDDDPAEITPTEPEGLVSLHVAAGRHTITIDFGETPLRLACDAISLLALAALATLALFRPAALNLTDKNDSSIRPPPSHRPAPHCPSSHSSSSPCSSFIVSLFIVSFSLVVLKLAVVDRTSTPFRRPALEPGGTLPGVAYPLGRSYDDGLVLIGYEQEPATLPADGTPRVDLYWTATDPPAGSYQSVIHLAGAGGLRWSGADTFRPRGYSGYLTTRAWGPTRYALDSHEIEPLPGCPPGIYDLVLTVFDRETLAPLSVLDQQGRPAAPRLTLGQIVLERPRRPAEVDAAERLDARMGDLTLLTAGFDRDHAAPGDPVFVSTLWHTEAQPAGDLAFQLALVAADGSRSATYSLPAGMPWHPTSAWQPGDTWRAQHEIRLPATLDTHTYTWTLSLAPHPAISLSPLAVTAPPHAYAAPPVDAELDVRLGDVATLVGAILQPPPPAGLHPGTSLSVTLVWRAAATPNESYHVFVHLFDPTGELVAQSDGVPAGWSRPTTGWLPGEIVIDTHTLTIPAGADEGAHTLAAGLYLPGGERLTDPAGNDSIPLGNVEVQGE
jgi:hypothetical protein